jgi:hypothetical protein
MDQPVAVGEPDAPGAQHRQHRPVGRVDQVDEGADADARRGAAQGAQQQPPDAAARAPR